MEHLDAILNVADGVMVARGDLGLECRSSRCRGCRSRSFARRAALGRPVIVATQVLESMRTEPRPTRAEVSDAANAVDEGADAIMLAGETATGAYPVRAVETLAAVIRDAETLPPGEVIAPEAELTLSRHGRALCEAAVTLATTGQAAAIVAVTQQGRTARLLSALRPRASIVAVTESEAVARGLALYWGVLPVVSSCREIGELQKPLRETAGIPEGSVVVFVNFSQDLTRVDANFINVQQLGIPIGPLGG